MHNILLKIITKKLYFMVEPTIVSIIKNLQLETKTKFISDIVPNIINSATFQAKIKKNGGKQIQIQIYKPNLYVFVCNGGHVVSSKNFHDFCFSKYKIRIRKHKPVLVFGDKIIKKFSTIPIEFNVIYWVSWRTKNHESLKNRADIFYLRNGILTNKLFTKKRKYNKKYKK
jgi:hypothetical protein